MDSRGGYISKNVYVKTKESEPLGGGGVRQASVNVDPPLQRPRNDYQTVSGLVANVHKLLLFQQG